MLVDCFCSVSEKLWIFVGDSFSLLFVVFNQNSKLLGKKIEIIIAILRGWCWVHSSDSEKCIGRKSFRIHLHLPFKVIYPIQLNCVVPKIVIPIIWSSFYSYFFQFLLHSVCTSWDLHSAHAFIRRRHFANKFEKKEKSTNHWCFGVIGLPALSEKKKQRKIDAEKTCSMRSFAKTNQTWNVNVCVFVRTCIDNNRQVMPF